MSTYTVGAGGSSADLVFDSPPKWIPPKEARKGDASDALSLEKIIVGAFSCSYSLISAS